MSRNDVFVQRDVRAVTLRHTSVGVFLRIDTVISLIVDVIQTNQCLVLAEIKGCQVRDWIVGK